MLALTCGGAIPELADYRVVLDPDDTFIGTLNEDFAIESTAGDVFQLGNASWRVLQIGAGVVRVADAQGTPPNLPFWIGEAPARSDELSQAVSRLRAALEGELPAGTAVEWLMRECLLGASAAEQIATYLGESFRMLGGLPTHDTLIAERFFDDSGGMQLVLHAPFGSRVNRAWGLALRKRFCRQFNFELQAAATEDGLLLSLGPQHSFPLTDVFRYLHPATARDVLVQAFLDAPVFQTRWRWNATISLAVPRSRGGRKVPPQLQRTLADDLLAAVFPDAAACLENIPGDRQVPDHPLVNQTVRDCLEEAMDFEQLGSILTRIHAGAIRLVARDTPEPSPLAHEILNARPYAFLDDAPLEERRTQAVHSRRATQPATGDDLCALDLSAITRVREDARPDPRDADELHDALLTGGLLREGDVPAEARDWFAELARRGRAACMAFDATADTGGAAWIATERSTEIRAVHPQVPLQPDVHPPASRAGHQWSRDAALVELVRGRLTIEGPTTMPALAGTLGVGIPDIEQSLLALETEGVVLRGSFTPGVRDLEWCDRRLLARIHRHTLDRLRAEIVPASPAEFMRFLFAWQHVESSSRLAGIDGLRVVLALLDGTEAPARAWERSVLPARVEDFDASMLDMLCLTGEVGWARLSAGPAQVVGATPIALFLREHADDWQALRGSENDEDSAPSAGPSAPASAGDRVLDLLRERGASFAHELTRACGLDHAALKGALAELAAAGLVSSDAFAGVRQLVEGDADSGFRSRGADGAGRWWAVTREGSQVSRERAVEQQARALLRRYGIVCRRLLAREANAAPWRELTRVYRRLEARGEIRGGRFVSGLSGEQFALPEAVERLREIRRSDPNAHVIVISAADPLNLTGIITSGERVRSVSGNRVAYRDGIPVAAMEGDYIRPLADVPPETAEAIACALAGRRVPVVSGYVGALRN
jgi:ATP-dependent Lhr-like helicase